MGTDRNLRYVRQHPGSIVADWDMGTDRNVRRLSRKQVAVKPGGTTQEFNSVNYECLQASQQREAYSNLSYNSLLGGYQGGSGNTVNTNNQLFNACMNAKGWALQAQQAQRSVAPSVAPECLAGC